MPRGFPPFSSLKKHALSLLGGALVFGVATAASAQQPAPIKQPAPAPKPMPAAGAATVIPPAPHPGPVVGGGCCSTGCGQEGGGGGGHFSVEAMFGKADCPAWTPLCCSNLGEGWFDAWIRPPDGSSGAPRQGWLNTADGFFTREFHLFYAFTDNAAKLGDVHLGLF